MEIDLSQLMAYGKTAAIGGLSLTAIWALLWPIFKKWFESLPRTNEELLRLKEAEKGVISEKVEELKKTVSSERKPPAGFSDHVETILKACTYADSSVKLRYLVQGLTEIEVLRQEIARMGNPVSPSPKETGEIVITNPLKESPKESV